MVRRGAQLQVLKVATTPDPDERLLAVRTLLAEETRIGMLIGVLAVGSWRALDQETEPPPSPAAMARLAGQSCVRWPAATQFAHGPEEVRPVTETAIHRNIERDDFRATRDPALLESADSGRGQLLTYAELYLLWERSAGAFRISTSRRTASIGTSASPRPSGLQRMYGLVLALHRRAAGGGRAWSHDARLPGRGDAHRCTRSPTRGDTSHSFNRFYHEVAPSTADQGGRLEETSAHLNENFGRLRRDARRQGRSARP